MDGYFDGTLGSDPRASRSSAPMARLLDLTQCGSGSEADWPIAYATAWGMRNLVLVKARLACYLFKHALVQDAAYGTLLREPRRVLHARIAETLDSQFAEIADNQPELLARHC